MKSTTIRLSLFLAGAFALLSANQASADLVTWDVDPAQSYMRLAIPDQTITIDTTTATVRVRAANNGAWNDSTGARAFLDGSLSTDLVDGSSITFNGGAHNLFALQGGAYRPSTAQWDPNATNAENPDGQYTGTGTQPAAFAGKIRASVSILTVDLAYIAFRNVFLDAASGSLALGGGTTFAGGSNNFGIQSALLDVDGLSALIVGQPVPDLLNEPLAGLTGVNTLGGTVQNMGGLLRKLTLSVNVPIAIDLDGTIVNATASGQVVAFATIPEPSSILLAGFASVGLFVAGRRRLRRN